jgi:hypothetical protein
MRAPCIVFALVVAATASASEPIRFHGQKITGADGDFQITPMGKKDAVVYVDLKRRFSVVLPYSEDWVFDRDSPDRVTAHAGTLNLSVEMFPNTSDNDRAYLEAVASALLASKDVNGTTAAKVQDAAGQPVIAIIADAEIVAKDPRFRGIKQYGFIASRVSDGVRFKYHLSVLDQDAKGTKSASSLLKYAVKGFMVGTK